MTCTTHHICDCLKKKMEKLEAVVRAIRDTRVSPDAVLEAWDRLDRALAELEQK